MGQLRTVSCTCLKSLIIRTKLKQKTVARCDLGPIFNNCTVAHAVLHKFYLKQQIKARWILFTSQTNERIVAQNDLTPIMSNGTIAHSFLHVSKVINNIDQVKAEKQLRSFDLGPIFNNCTVAHAVLHKFYLKQEIKVRWILFTSETKKRIVAQDVLTPFLSNGTVAHIFLAQVLGL